MENMDEGSSEGGMNVEYTDEQHEVKNREDAGSVREEAEYSLERR
jgi:hypothetical protein